MEGNKQKASPEVIESRAPTLLGHSKLLQRYSSDPSRRPRVAASQAKDDTPQVPSESGHPWLRVHTVVTRDLRLHSLVHRSDRNYAGGIFRPTFQGFVLLLCKLSTAGEALLSVGKSPVHIVMHNTNREENPKGAQRIPALTLQPRQEGDDRMHLDLIGLNQKAWRIKCICMFNPCSTLAVALDSHVCP